MNAAETAFHSKNPLFVGLANYLEKKDLLSDFQEKIANLQVLKRVKLEEYHIVFDALNQARAKRKTLIQLYLKIGRCVYYINSLTYRLNQYYSTVTPEFFKATQLPEKTQPLFTAVYYLLDGKISSWTEIEEKLCSEEFVNRVTNVKSGDVTDEKSAYLKEQYLQNPEFKSSITGLSEGFEFLRVLMEWLIALVLFRDYPEQMKDLDELILKVNEDKSALENDEILMRTLVLDIAGQIDSLTFRTQALQEEVEIALGEESARESIKGHLSNDFVGTYDISEILTRQLNDTQTTDLTYPSTIRLAIESNPKEINLSRSNSAGSENRLPPDFKLATFVSRRLEDDFPGTSATPSVTTSTNQRRSKSMVKKNASDAALDNQKLFEELEQMKRQLLEDSKKQKNIERPATENVEEHYLKFLNQNHQTGPSSEIEQNRKNTGRTDSNFNPDFEQIEVLSVSDNVSQNKLNLSRDDSQIQSKFLNETGFSKFDALVRKNKRNQKQKEKEEDPLMVSGLSFNPTLILTPQNTQDIGNIDLGISSHSYVGRATTQGKTLSQMEIFERDDALRKINEKIKNDADLLETLDKHALGSQIKVGDQDLGKAVIQSDFTYGRGSNQRRTLSGSEDPEKMNIKESIKLQFTSFKNEQRDDSLLLSPLIPSPGGFRLHTLSMEPGDRTPQSLGSHSTSIQPLQNEEIMAIVEAHKMIKKSAVDLGGIIDGYLDWKFEEFKAEFCRVSSFIFPPKLAEELIRTVSKKNDKSLEVTTYSLTSQPKSPEKSATVRKLFKFVILRRLKTRQEEQSFKRQDSDVPWGNSTLDVNNSFCSPRDSIPPFNSGQQSIVRTPPSPVTPNFVPFSPTVTPFLSPTMSAKQTPFMQALSGSTAGKTVVFQNAVLKNDKFARPVPIVETSFQKKSEAVVMPAPSVKFVNASHGLFAKGVQTPQIKTQLGFIPPLKEQQPVRDLWPKIFEKESTRPVLKSPPKTLRNSFNEGVLENPENSFVVKDHSPGGHVIRNSASTQAGNSTSHGDRSPSSVVVNGKELYLVRVDKEGLVYRSKEDLHK